MNAMQAAMSEAGFKVTVQATGHMDNNGNHTFGTNGKQMQNNSHIHHGFSVKSEDGWRERSNARPMVVTRGKYQEIH